MGTIDLDMSLLRAFIVTAEELHFGRAAERLTLTQQALSKRIRKLETAVGLPLFDRSTRTVRLTEAGRRFLAPAAEALAAADAAVAAVRSSPRALRVDVLHDRLAPALMMRRFTEEQPGVTVEISSRRSLGLAVPALLRGEIDLTFGRVADDLAKVLTHRVVRLEPLVVVVDSEHPLTRLDTVRPADLTAYGVWTPMPGSASEWSGYVEHFAVGFACPLVRTRVDSVSAQEVLERSAGGGPAFLSAGDVGNPEHPRLRLLDLVDPVPVYPWSVVWRAAERHPLVLAAITTLGDLSRTDKWCSAGDRATWMPPDTIA